MNERKWTLRQVIASSQPELIQSWNNSSSCSELQTGKYITQVTEFIFPSFPNISPDYLHVSQIHFLLFYFPGYFLNISESFPRVPVWFPALDDGHFSAAPFKECHRILHNNETKRVLHF